MVINSKSEKKVLLSDNKLMNSAFSYHLVIDAQVEQVEQTN